MKKIREPVDGVIWSDREFVVAIERARMEGWNAALRELDGARRRRGGSGGGVGAGKGGVRAVGVDDDLRRLVGERFATGLEGVWLASLRYLRGTVPGDGGDIGSRMGSGSFRAGKGLTDRRLVMGGSRGGFGGRGTSRGVSNSTGGVIRDEVALAFKARVDSKLRKLTREMERWLEVRENRQEVEIVKRCVRCKKFGEETWQYCPFDGQKME